MDTSGLFLVLLFVWALFLITNFWATITLTIFVSLILAILGTAGDGDGRQY